LLHPKKVFAAGGLPLLMLLSGCAPSRPTGVFVDPAFGPLIPPDTKVMAGIRLDKLRETPLYKKLDSQFDLERRLNLFSERTGLDPRKDMWQVLFISDGTHSLVLARGRFTTGEMEPRLGELGGSRTEYKDYTIIGTPQTSVFFLNPGVAVAGAKSDLEHLIDHRAEYSKIPDGLDARLKELPTSDQLWLISDGVFPESVLAGPDTTGAKSMASNLVGYVRSVQVGVRADQGVDLQGKIDCVSVEGAQRVRDTLKGIVGLGRLSTRDDQMELLKVYDSAQVTQSNSAVTFSASVAPNLVDPLLKMALRQKGR
jgi:hypothetical protein